MRGGQRPNYCTGGDRRESLLPKTECWPAIGRESTRRSSSRRRGEVYSPATVEPPAVMLPNRRVQWGLMMSGGRLRWGTARHAHDADVGRETPLARWRRSGPRVWGARPRAVARWQPSRLPLGCRGRLGHDVYGCARLVVWQQGTCGCPVTTGRSCRRRSARDGPRNGRQSSASQVGAPRCGSPLRYHHHTNTCIHVYACMCAHWGGGASINTTDLHQG